MKYVVKTLALLLAAVMLLSLAGCKDSLNEAAAPTQEPVQESTYEPTEAPTPEPTEEPTPEPTEEPAPEPTEEPTPEPTLMPTEVPAEAKPLEGSDFFAMIRLDQPMIVDIDGDGEDDIVLVYAKTEEEDYGYCHYVVSITRACKPEDPYTFETEFGTIGILGVVADCDPSDARKELIFSFDQEDADFLTYAFRLKDDGSDFESFMEPMLFIDDAPLYSGLPDDFAYHAEEGFYIEKRTEILGTFFVANRVTVTKDGFKLLSDEFIYPYEWKLTLKRDLKLKTDKGKTVTAKKGSVIIPYSTDRKTFVKVKLADGTIGRAEVTFGHTTYDFPVYINGVIQDEYAEMPYAD